MDNNRRMSWLQVDMPYCTNKLKSHDTRASLEVLRQTPFSVTCSSDSVVRVAQQGYSTGTGLSTLQCLFMTCAVFMCDGIPRYPRYMIYDRICCWQTWPNHDNLQRSAVNNTVSRHLADVVVCLTFACRRGATRREPATSLLRITRNMTLLGWLIRLFVLQF